MAIAADTAGREREVRVLAALAGGVLGEVPPPEVPGRMLAFLDQLPPARRGQLTAALRLLDTRVGALALTGRPTPASALGVAEAEAVYRRWLYGRLAVGRLLARAVGTAALSSLYGYPGPGWERTGYPGPDGPAPAAPVQPRLDVLTPSEDTELDCDVVIVGSGAGGGVVAGELAARGFDVVVLEKGGYYTEADFHHHELTAARELYLYGQTLTTDDMGVAILAGSTLGGGTVVNYTTSFVTPDDVLAEWHQVSGVEAFANGEAQESLKAVAERVGISTEESAPGARDALMERGLGKLGWHCAPLPRNTHGCKQDAGCGWCGFGCRYDAKGSTLKVYLREAAARGAKLLVRTDARRVLVKDGTAVGVEAIAAGGHRVRVRARAVVAAAGAIETPALLLRSGLGGQVGRHLRLHPGTAAFGTFDEPVRVWEGTLQARYSAELRERLGPYGPILETVPIHPGMGAAFLPWGRSAAAHRELVAQLANLSLVGVLCRDKTTGGRVRLYRDGSPRVTYKLTPEDEQLAVEGVAAAAEVLAAAGATRIWSVHPQGVSYRPDAGPGARAAWLEEVRRLGFRKGAAMFVSYHQMGSCRMGVDPATSAVNADHETHQVRNLFVADASLFPTASGVNPMTSVMGLAHRAAGRVAARLA